MVDYNESMLSQSIPQARPQLRSSGFGRLFRDILETIVFVAVVFTLVNLATSRFVVDGISMQPNFATGQYVVVSRINYLFGEPELGDIVVFQYPNNPRQDYIKRVIGVPGDTVEIRDQQVYVNGVRLNESYINEPCSRTSCPDRTWVLGEDQFFVMGDNRNNSTDSRSFNAVDRHFIIGEALFRYFPFSDIGIVNKIGFEG
jgi:signal peptidase I